MWGRQGDHAPPSRSCDSVFDKIDNLLVGDWLIKNDQRLRATRAFQILRLHDQACVMRAEIDYICINVASGRPQRMPKGFVDAYAVM